MGKKKVVTTEIVEDDTIKRVGTLEEESGSTEPEAEIDQIESCKHAVKEVGSRRITVFRIDPMSHRESHVASLVPEQLSWEILQKYGSGEYIIKVLHPGGEVVYDQIVMIDTTTIDAAHLAYSSFGKDLSPQGVTDTSATTSLMNMMERMLNKMLAERGLPINPPSTMPDMTVLMQSMASAMSAGVTGAMSVVTSVIQKTMEMNLESRDPKNVIANLKDMIELANEVKGGGRMNESWMEALFKKGIDILGPVIATNMMVGMKQGMPPTPTIPTAVRTPETPKLETKPITIVQDNPPTTQPEPPKPTFEQMLFYYTSELSKITARRSPGIAAELFFEDLPDDHVPLLEKFLANDPVNILFQFAPHTVEKKEWFTDFIENLKDVVGEYNNKGESEGETEAEVLVHEAKGRKRTPIN